MTEQDLIKLGFEKIEIDDIFDDNDKNTYYYYVFCLSYDVSLCTPCNDEIDGEWFVEFNEITDLKFRTKKQVATLIKLIQETFTITNDESYK